MNKIKSTPLKRNGKINIVAPSGPVLVPKLLEKCIAVLNREGYQIQCRRYLCGNPGYLAGTDGERLGELTAAWVDDSTDAVWCARGGYGVTRILSDLNYEKFAAFSPLLIGFSDITALELALWQKNHFVSFHGAMILNLEDEFSRRQSLRMLSGALKIEEPFLWPGGWRTEVLNPGKAEGFLLGGNLSLICSLLGTEFMPDFHGSLLFLEEAYEETYRVDRLLTQALNAGIFEGVNAVLIGRSIPIPGETEADLRRIYSERLSSLKCPIGYGFPLGHMAYKWTVPQGIEAFVNMEKSQFFLLESPFNV